MLLIWKYSTHKLMQFIGTKIFPNMYEKRTTAPRNKKKKEKERLVGFYGIN